MFPLAPVFIAACLGAPDTTRLDLRVEPLADLALATRFAATEESHPLPAAFEVALLPLRRLEETIGPRFLAWGVIDRLVFEGGTAVDLLERLRGLPESIPTFPDGSIAIRDDAIAWGEALVELEATFLADVWPARRDVILAARADVEERFRPHEAACFAAMLDALAIPDPREAIPVMLVHDAPWPGAVTFRGEDGGGVCIVSVTSHRGTLLFETLLHEATHALDVRTPPGVGVLETLRERLLERGVGPRDRALRNIPHTLMFVQAAETIRRHVDPEHVDYGVAAGYYDKVPEIAEVERRIWPEVLDGERTRDSAIAAIVDALAPAK